VSSPGPPAAARQRRDCPRCHAPAASRVIIIQRRVAADGERIEVEIIHAVVGDAGQRGEDLAVGVDRAADAGRAGAMDEHDTVSRVGGHRLAGVEDEIQIAVRVNQCGVNGGRNCPGRRGNNQIQAGWAK